MKCKEESGLPKQIGFGVYGKEGLRLISHEERLILERKKKEKRGSKS